VNAQTYSRLAGTIFAIIAILHLIRGLRGAEATLDGDLYARISEAAGWEDDRPRLSKAEISELAGLIEPALSENEREQFGVYVQRIFARAVDGLLTKQKYDDQPVVAIRDQLVKFLKEMERAQAAIDGLDEGVWRLLDNELAMLARAQNAPRHLP